MMPALYKQSGKDKRWIPTHSPTRTQKRITMQLVLPQKQLEHMPSKAIRQEPQYKQVYMYKQKKNACGQKRRKMNGMATII